MPNNSAITLFISGDVMTGRGIDQILPHPCDPTLYERYVASALDYVALAEDANGPIPRPVDFTYVWGEALAAFDRHRSDARLINLETAITTSTDVQPKGINYRMHPANVPVLTAAGINCCTLANNHLLDWGYRGLIETLEALHGNNVATAGAGRSLAEATRPALLPVLNGRLVVYAFGLTSSGIPPRWAATAERSGINVLPNLGSYAVDDIADQLQAVRKPGDLIVVSLHWGGNWGYEVPRDQQMFAHRLIDDAGVDLVWGHSSHHAKAIEVHSGKLILYGCGDFIDDYEGIRGEERYRPDLVLMYFPILRLADGQLQALTMVPMRIRRMRLVSAPPDEAMWLRDRLNREGDRFGTCVELGGNNELTLSWDKLA